MYHVSRNLDEFFEAAGPEAAKRAHAGLNNAQVAQAIRLTWGDNPAAARYIMLHINAFYVREDTTPRKGPDKDKRWMVGEFCLNDSMAKAELNARRELLHGALASYGINVNEIRIKSATRDMRNRHPFEKLADSTVPETVAATRGVESQDVDEITAKEKAAVLQTFKRACCLVFGSDAAEVLAAVNVAQVRAAQNRRTGSFQDFATSDARSRRRRFFINLYGDKAALQRTVATADDSLRAHCRDLGTTVLAISCEQARESDLEQAAFPPAGVPVSL